MRQRPHSFVLSAFLVGFAALALGKTPPSTTDWPLFGGSAESQQFSTIGQIDASNNSSLGLRRHTDLPIHEGLVGPRGFMRRHLLSEFASTPIA